MSVPDFYTAGLTFKLNTDHNTYCEDLAFILPNIVAVDCYRNDDSNGNLQTQTYIVNMGNQDSSSPYAANNVPYFFHSRKSLSY